MARLRRPLRYFWLLALGLLAVHFSTRWGRGHSLFLSRHRATVRLESTLAELQALHVGGYRELSWCQLLTLDDATYSDSTQPTTCCWGAECRPFDPHARRVHAKVRALLADTGVRVDGLLVDADRDRKLRSAEFTLSACPFCREAYEYRAPGQGEPTPVPGELDYERIRLGWYLRVEDWN